MRFLGYLVLVACLACSSREGPDDASTLDTSTDSRTEDSGSADTNEDSATGEDAGEDAGDEDAGDDDASVDAGEDASTDAALDAATDSGTSDAATDSGTRPDTGAAPGVCSEDRCTPTCFRPMSCVTACGGPVTECGCCACAPGSIDTIECP